MIGRQVAPFSDAVLTPQRTAFWQASASQLCLPASEPKTETV
jgi:hypothetical protein